MVSELCIDYSRILIGHFLQLEDLLNDPIRVSINIGIGNFDYCPVESELNVFPDNLLNWLFWHVDYKEIQKIFKLLTIWSIIFISSILSQHNDANIYQ